MVISPRGPGPQTQVGHAAKRRGRSFAGRCQCAVFLANVPAGVSAKVPVDPHSYSLGNKAPGKFHAHDGLEVEIYSAAALG